ncbi:hypothetical protein PRIPAC_87575 [Pristionchus pacificus]|uniref:Uncharacterized protein n=1 Tax=Pristionchus pacificus TaxID=54126 RepID=A0A2A6CWF7_PRIPA|nr:hypothetical protein PRIPAC_87575 [Pristionchus pacificus]|eukprot:PDM82377.1 hypothetical protein PRIPAC_36770 [Pristionchus pacificus]
MLTLPLGRDFIGFGRLRAAFLLAATAAEAARALNSYQTGKVDEDTNRARRHSCYRVIIASTMGPLGRGIRIRLPACVIKAVRAKWPSATYSGFRPSELIDE